MSPFLSRPALVLLAGLSGFAGLGYELVWTREFALGLGSEMMAVLGSVAGLFGGMALGALLLDARLRRARSPWRAYAWLEGVIGLWGVASMPLLPAAMHALLPRLGTTPAPSLHWLASFLVPALLLLPATAAMGGTLTALGRMLDAHSTSGRPVAALAYGANTAGAVAGTLATVAWLMPAWGLSGTLLALATLNMMCAALSLWLGSRLAARAPGPPDVASAPGATAAGGARLSWLLFASGLLGITVEVLVVRIAAEALQNTLYTFAGLLAAYLAGSALGGLLWQKVPQAWRTQVACWLPAATAVACIGTAALAPIALGGGPNEGAARHVPEWLLAVALWMGPSLCMGALFAYLAEQVQARHGSLGRAVGINAAGAAVAPLLASLGLVPLLGAWTSLVCAGLAYLALMPARRQAFAFGVVPVACAALLIASGRPNLVAIPEGGSLLATREGPMATASVVTDAAGIRFLEVNGHFRMGGTSSQRSDTRQALLPLLLHPHPARAAFLGVGTGATLAGALRMPGVTAVGVELLPEVVQLLPWFALPDDADRHPTLVLADARRWVEAGLDPYDVVVADLFHPALDGSGALYTREHFATIRRRLAPGGLFCQWLPLYQLDMPSLQAIVRSFLDVYPGGTAWLNHYSVGTPMLALVGLRDGEPIEAAAIARHLDAPGVAAAVGPWGFGAGLDLPGQFVAGPRALAALAGAGPRNTDDYPFVALDAERNVQALSAPPARLLLALLQAVRAEPAELLGAQATPAATARLGAYWQARNRFLAEGAALAGAPRGRALVDAASPGLLQVVRLSAEFEPAYQPLLSMARSLLDSDPPAARQLLQAIVAAAPERPEARELLGAAAQLRE